MNLYIKYNSAHHSKEATSNILWIYLLFKNVLVSENVNKKSNNMHDVKSYMHDGKSYKESFFT